MSLVFTTSSGVVNAAANPPDADPMHAHVHPSNVAAVMGVEEDEEGEDRDDSADAEMRCPSSIKFSIRFCSLLRATTILIRSYSGNCMNANGISLNTVVAYPR